jgi:hypothetical protein
LTYGLNLCYCCLTVKTRSVFYFYAYFYGRPEAPLLAFE